MIGDLILLEVLQGFSDKKAFEQARRLLASCALIDLAGETIAVQAARNCRALKRIGVTVRKTIGTILATRCIMSGYTLLHNDRDFNPFLDHLGLRVVLLKSRGDDDSLLAKLYFAYGVGSALKTMTSVGRFGSVCLSH